jgi:hypothetical protein
MSTPHAVCGGRWCGVSGGAIRSAGSSDCPLPNAPIKGLALCETSDRTRIARAMTPAALSTLERKGFGLTETKYQARPQEGHRTRRTLSSGIRPGSDYPRACPNRHDLSDARSECVASRLAAVRRSPRCIVRQHSPHVGLGQTELPGDLRGLDASLEGRANGVQLSRRQLNGGRVDLRLVRGPS